MAAAGRRGHTLAKAGEPPEVVAAAASPTKLGTAPARSGGLPGDRRQAGAASQGGRASDSRLAAAARLRRGHGVSVGVRLWRRVVVATTDAAAVRTSPACEGQRRSVGDGARVAGWWDGCVWRRCTARVGFGERGGRATTPRRASVGLHAGGEPPAR
ncbi:hypothetical protein OsI_09904 [Oryza sativa Indica Group]|uniref:Uncharacterized protein n=1 Tax=Oryza sativa subsp. indica TaxID=39946 RepID=B8AMT8_ORYSI|nr:hypothetical protein OsI_09904 [Oryza sativa Indica Group]